MKLTKKDYLLILKYYNIDTNELNDKDIQTKAETILATKMCRCIKSVVKTNKKTLIKEQNAIAICKESVINKKNLNIFRFTCKKKPQLLPKTNDLNSDIKIHKIKSKLKLYTTKRLRQLKENKRKKKQKKTQKKEKK
jgi:hypothetical protein